jgi:uncharacterized protein YdhG (YjbR/CyaY superfamily)
MEKFTAKSIDDYIKRQPKEVQPTLKKMRETIRKAAPEAEEVISYQMPTFKQGRNLIHFAAFTSHVSIFPGAEGVAYFEKELTKYKTSKGTVQFPLGEPIPYGLISRITKFRVRVEKERAKKKFK